MNVEPTTIGAPAQSDRNHDSDTILQTADDSLVSAMKLLTGDAEAEILRVVVEVAIFVLRARASDEAVKAMRQVQLSVRRRNALAQIHSAIENIREAAQKRSDAKSAKGLKLLADSLSGTVSGIEANLNAGPPVRYVLSPAQMKNHRTIGAMFLGKEVSDAKLAGLAKAREARAANRLKRKQEQSANAEFSPPASPPCSHPLG